MFAYVVPPAWYAGLSSQGMRREGPTRRARSRSERKRIARMREDLDKFRRRAHSRRITEAWPALAGEDHG